MPSLEAVVWARTLCPRCHARCAMLRGMGAQATASSVGRRTFAPGGTVTLAAGVPPVLPDAGHFVIARERTAAMLVELATHARLYEDVDFGTVHLDLTPKKVTLRVERVCQPIHLAEPAVTP